MTSSLETLTVTMTTNDSMTSISTTPSPSCTTYKDPNKEFYQFRQVTDLLNGTTCIILIPLVCFGNFLVLACLWRYRRLRTVTNTFIGNLSVADSIVGLVTLPMYALFYLKYESVNCNKYLCLFKYSSVTCSMSGSMISLVAIAFDRYVAIIHPLKYQSWMTKTRIKIFFVIMWIYLMITSLLPYVWNNYDSVQTCDYFRIFPKAFTIYATFVSIFVSVTVSLFMYISIFRVARAQHKQIQKDSAHFRPTDKKQFDKETKSAKDMALVLFLFYIFWLPFAFTGPLKYLKVPDNLATSLKNLTLSFAMINSMINPLIYGYRRRDFRRAFLGMLTDNVCCVARTTDRKGSILLSQTNSIDARPKEEADPEVECITMTEQNKSVCKTTNDHNGHTITLNHNTHHGSSL